MTFRGQQTPLFPAIGICSPFSGADKYPRPTVRQTPLFPAIGRHHRFPVVGRRPRLPRFTVMTLFRKNHRYTPQTENPHEGQLKHPPKQTIPPPQSGQVAVFT